MLLATSRPRRNEAVLSQHASGETVLLNVGDGQYYALEGVGGRVWELCDGSRPLAEVARIIAAEFDARVAEIEADVLELMSDLQDAKLVSAS
jgi:pyrroloquinoline quinone biosynthesis protein D